MILLEWSHVLNFVILLGTMLGSTFFLYMVNREKNVPGIYSITRQVVRSNYILILPTAIIQLGTGVALIQQRGYSFMEGWIVLTTALYLLACICWFFVILTQRRMRNMAEAAFQGTSELPPLYWKMHRRGIVLAILAFLLLVAISYFMMATPQIALFSANPS